MLKSDAILMPSLHSHRRHSSRLMVRCERDEAGTNADIHTLVWRDKVETFSFPFPRDWFADILLENFEMKQEQVENMTDKTNVPFTLSSSSHLVLSQRECKLGITEIELLRKWSKNEKKVLIMNNFCWNFEKK